MRLWLALVLALLFVPSIDATVVLPAQFADVVSGSELIVYGRVTSVTPEWTDGRRRIETLVTVDVLSWFKGGSGAALTFVVPGGEIGRYRNVLVGAPVFRPGDEAFLFLRRQGAAAPHVFGLNQGVFRVRLDQRGVRQVTSPLLAPSGAAPVTVKRGDPSRRPMAVDAFGARIRTALAAGTRAR
jgi:hypothetical protein